MGCHSSGFSEGRQLVVFSPMPPRRNGIADYVAEQLPYHCRKYSITVVIGNADPEPIDLPDQVDVLRLEQYKARFREFSGYSHIYHIGNNADHGYMLPVLYKRPGVVVIHDLGLHHLIDTQTLVKGNRDGYAWALWQQYGRAGKRMGEQFQAFGWKGQMMQQELHLNSAIIKAAQRVIVHSNYSACRILAEFPDKPVTVIPHHLSPAINRYNRARRTEARFKLDLPVDRPILTSLGFITRPKQVEAILRVLSKLKKQGLSFYYVLAGEYRPDEYDVKADIKRYRLQSEVVVTDFLDEDAFFTHLVATDIILNLRYPSGGETSGTLTRALGLGRCCVVINTGAFAEIPSDCAAKLDWDEEFETNLENCIVHLLRDPQSRAHYETQSRDWVTAKQAIQKTTKSYHAAIDALPVPQPESSSLLMNSPGCRSAVYLDAVSIERELQDSSDELLAVVSDGVGMLWWRQGLVAQADGTTLGVELHKSDQIDSVMKILNLQLDYTPEQVVILKTKQADNQREFYRYLAVKALSDMATDPVLQIACLSACMAMGGELVLSIQDLVLPEMANPKLLAPQGWLLALECAGFQPIEYHSAPSDITFSEMQLQVPELVFRARKVSERVERYPVQLYVGQTNKWTTIRKIVHSNVADDGTQKFMSLETETV